MGRPERPQRRKRGRQPLDLGDPDLVPGLTADETGPDGSWHSAEADGDGVREASMQRERPPHHGD